MESTFGGKFVSSARDLWRGIQPFSIYFGAEESQFIPQKSIFWCNLSTILQTLTKNKARYLKTKSESIKIEKSFARILLHEKN